MTGDVLEAVPRNLVEIEMLLVRDANGKMWEFATEGPIGIDAAHLLVHRDIGAGVEVIYLEKDGRLSYRRRSRGFKSQEWLDFFCATQFRDGVYHTGEWVKGGYWYPAQKIAVLGENVWANASFTVKVKDGARVVTGNGLPVGHPTGNFPIARNDPAYQFYPNSNAISEQSVEFSLPLRPIFAAIPSCIPMGMVGVATNGVAFSMAWTRWPMRCRTDAPDTRSVMANTTTTARVVAIPMPKRRLIRWLALRWTDLVSSVSMMTRALR